MKCTGVIIFSIVSGVTCIAGITSEIASGKIIGSYKEHFQSSADSAAIIINKYIDALGGLEKLSSIRTVYMEGTYLVRGQKNISKTWIINNKSMRNESISGGFASWNIVRKDSGWSYNPRRGQKLPEPWPQDRVKIARPGLDIAGPLVDYKKKGYTVEYKGIEQIEGSDTYKVEEKLNDTITKTFFIDLDSYLVIRVRSKYTTPNRVSYSNTDFGNYRKTKDGYIFPMQVADLKYTTIVVNDDISNDFFIPKK